MLFPSMGFSPWMIFFIMNESGLPTDFLTVLALEVVERSSALDVSMVPLWSRGCFSHVSSPAGWHGPHGVRISSEMSPKLHPQPLSHPCKCEILAINPYHDPQAVSFINFPFIPSPFQVRILSINLKVSGLKHIPSIPIPWSTLVRYFITWTFWYEWWN